MSRFLVPLCVIHTTTLLVTSSDGPWSLPGYPWNNGITRTNKRNRDHSGDDPLDLVGLSDVDDDLLLQYLDNHEDMEELVFGIQQERENDNDIRKKRGWRINRVELTLSQREEPRTEQQPASSSSPLSTLFQQSIPVLREQQESSTDEPFQTATRLRSTGTTIVGCVVGGCVVLGADTRATDDRMVADKRCEKVHCLASNVWCCGAGTSADLDALVRQVRYTLALQNLVQESVGNQDTTTTSSTFDEDNERSTHQQPARGIFTTRVHGVSLVCRLLRDHLYEGGGNIGANLVLGGYDHNSGEAILVAIHPHGSMDVVPYSALGSGGLAAMAVLESRYHANLTLDEGIALVQDAVKAGIDNDLGSGSQIDLVVLGTQGANYTRGVVPEEEVQSNHTITSETPVTGGLIASTKPNQQLEGVNGFGNLPYTVQSTRVLRRSQEYEETKRQETWNEILGL